MGASPKRRLDAYHDALREYARILRGLNDSDR
jgi:hypothetical protein